MDPIIKVQLKRYLICNFLIKVCQVKQKRKIVTESAQAVYCRSFWQRRDWYRDMQWLFTDRAEQRLRMCTDGRGLGSKLVSFAKRFSKHPHILAIFKVDSEYLRFPFKVKVDYFILYSILVHSFVIFLIFFAMNKKRRTNEAALLN